MKSDRPVNLNIFTITLPLPGIVSITHRITGGILFFGIAFALYALQMALSSEQGFADAAVMIQQPLAKFIMLALILTLVFHLVAGIKHLLLDFHMGDTIGGARTGSVVVIVLTVVITAVLGGLLW